MFWIARGGAEQGVAWKVPLPGPGASSAIASGDRIYVTAYSGHGVPGTPGGKQELVLAIFGKVLGLDPDTGAELWSCATGIGWYMVPSLVNDGDAVFCIGGRTGGGLEVLVGDRIVVPARQGGVLVLAARPKFELLSRNPMGDRSTFDASPSMAGGCLLVRSDRFLYAIGR